MRSRSERRRYRELLKKKRKRYGSGPIDSRPQPDSTIFTISEEERLSFLTRTPHPCSKFCCGNRRRYDGPRPSEIRRAPREEDWQDDLKGIAPGSQLWNLVCPDLLFWEKYGCGCDDWELVLEDEMDQKIWGETELLFSNSTVTVHILRVKKGGTSSWHYHDRKYNLFYVVSGRFCVRIADELSTFQVALMPGERLTVRPGEDNAHEFEALEDSVVIETCFVEDGGAVDPEDIHRFLLGSYKSPSGTIFYAPDDGTIEKEM